MSGAFLAGRAEAQTPAYTLYGSSSGTATTTIYAYNFSSSNTFVSQTTAINTGLNYVNGLAWDGTDSRLFYRSGKDTSTGSGIGTFYNWNRSTGAQTAMTQAAVTTGFTDVSSLGFANGSYYNNAYWTVATGTNDLYKVTFNASFTTYQAQLWLGNVNDGAVGDDIAFGDIAINSSGKLYGFGTVGSTAEFFNGTIPAAAGGASTTLTTPNQVNRGTDANVQLGFSQDGNVLYGATLSGSWFTMDQTTGVRTAYSGATAIPNTGLTDLTSAASYQPVPAPPAAISLGIGGLVGMIGTGVNRLRRNRKKK